MIDTTIDILAQELQLKQRRLDKYRDKIYEQQDVLKDKIKRINELKEELKELDGRYQEADHYADKFNADLKEKDKEIVGLKAQLRLADNLVKEQDEELSYSRGEHPVQKATNRKKTNGKFRKTLIN